MPGMNMGPGGPGGPPPGGPGGPPPRRGDNHNPFNPNKPGDNAPGDLFAEEFDIKQMEKESEEMVQMIYLNRDNSTFTKTDGGFLNLNYKGNTYKKVQVLRNFPFSDPDSYLSIRKDTDKAEEIGLIVDYKNDFDAATAALIAEQLDIRYFTPVITKILQVKEAGGFAYFDVMTDYGECQFSFRSNSSNIVHLSDTRLIIYDMDSNRFEIPDTNKLSSKELKKLDLFM